MCTYLDLSQGAGEIEHQGRGKVLSPAQFWGLPGGFLCGGAQAQPAQRVQKQLRSPRRYTKLMKSDWESELGEWTFRGGWIGFERGQREG